MFNDKTVAVVIPAYNEEEQILQVLEGIPAFVDRIVVVDDCSKDKTAEIVSNFILRENQNRPGIAITRKRSSKRDITEPIWCSTIWP